MSHYQPRNPTTFESTDGLTVVTFGLAEQQWKEQHPLVTPSAAVIGANYPHDYLGLSPAYKGPADEQLNYVVLESTPTQVDSDLDTLEANIFNIGLGRLYTTGADGTRRWAWARPVAMPAVTWNSGDIFMKTVFVDFRRQSDWYATSTSSYTTTVTAGQSPKSVTWNNPGTAKMKLTITAVALGSSGYSAGFTINNTTVWTSPLGQMTTSRVSVSTNSRVEFDSTRQRVRYSTDAGVTWADDYASVTLPDVQPDFVIELAPGDNTIVFTVGGTPNVTFNATGTAAYH